MHDHQTFVPGSSSMVLLLCVWQQHRHFEPWLQACTVDVFLTGLHCEATADTETLRKDHTTDKVG